MILRKETENNKLDIIIQKSNYKIRMNDTP